MPWLKQLARCCMEAAELKRSTAILVGPKKCRCGKCRGGKCGGGKCGGDKCGGGKWLNEINDRGDFKMASQC